VSIKLLKRQGGFTLLELLIVIVIIGILALLIIPNITSAPKKARDTKRKTDITTVRKGLEEYFVNNNAYPSTGGTGTYQNIATALAPLTTGSAPIIKNLPTDPKNSNPSQYAYTYASDGTAYFLNACLENDQDSGANVIAAVSPCTTKTFQVVNGN
jgi:general secretion pathway protein G